MPGPTVKVEILDYPEGDQPYTIMFMQSHRNSEKVILQIGDNEEYTFLITDLEHALAAVRQAWRP